MWRANDIIYFKNPFQNSIGANEYWLKCLIRMLSGNTSRAYYEQKCIEDFQEQSIYHLRLEKHLCVLKGFLINPGYLRV